MQRRVAQHLEGQPAGVGQAERVKGLAELDARIFDLEVREEEMIVEAEEAGFDVERRPDADPSVVLGIEVLGESEDPSPILNDAA